MCCLSACEAGWFSAGGSNAQCSKCPAYTFSAVCANPAAEYCSEVSCCSQLVLKSAQIVRAAREGTANLETIDKPLTILLTLVLAVFLDQLIVTAIQTQR